MDVPLYLAYEYNTYTYVCVYVFVFMYMSLFLFMRCGAAVQPTRKRMKLVSIARETETGRQGEREGG